MSEYENMSILELAQSMKKLSDEILHGDVVSENQQAAQTTEQDVCDAKESQ